MREPNSCWASLRLPIGTADIPGEAYYMNYNAFFATALNRLRKSTAIEVSVRWFVASLRSRHRYAALQDGGEP
jgi:hypothetical protein